MIVRRDCTSCEIHHGMIGLHEGVKVLAIYRKMNKKRKGKERKGKETKGNKRKQKETKGKERKGKDLNILKT